MIFSATDVTSFRVTPSIALRRCSAGFLQGFYEAMIRWTGEHDTEITK
jgi:hypothetical protein